MAAIQLNGCVASLGVWWISLRVLTVVKVVSEESGQFCRGVTGDWEAGAACRSVLGEAAEDNSSVRFEEVPHRGQVAVCVSLVGEELEHGPVVPQPETT